jgi:hypothetical protein
MSKLEEALAEVRRAVSGPPCSVGQLLATLEEEERISLLKLLNAEDYPRTPSSVLVRAISAAYGIDIHRQTVDRHRRSDCVCGRRFE